MVHNATWEIFDEVNQCEDLKIQFLDHEAQINNANEFIKNHGLILPWFQSV